jgi:hypothetical protein
MTDKPKKPQPNLGTPLGAETKGEEAPATNEHIETLTPAEMLGGEPEAEGSYEVDTDDDEEEEEEEEGEENPPAAPATDANPGIPVDDDGPDQIGDIEGDNPSEETTDPSTAEVLGITPTSPQPKKAQPPSPPEMDPGENAPLDEADYTGPTTKEDEYENGEEIDMAKIDYNALKWPVGARPAGAWYHPKKKQKSGKFGPGWVAPNTPGSFKIPPGKGPQIRKANGKRTAPAKPRTPRATAPPVPRTTEISLEGTAIEQIQALQVRAEQLKTEHNEIVEKVQGLVAEAQKEMQAQMDALKKVSISTLK